MVYLFPKCIHSILLWSFQFNNPFSPSLPCFSLLSSSPPLLWCSATVHVLSWSWTEHCPPRTRLRATVTPPPSAPNSNINQQLPEFTFIQFIHLIYLNRCLDFNCSQLASRGGAAVNSLYFDTGLDVSLGHLSRNWAAVYQAFMNHVFYNVVYLASLQIVLFWRNSSQKVYLCGKKWIYII